MPLRVGKFERIWNRIPSEDTTKHLLLHSDVRFKSLWESAQLFVLRLEVLGLRLEHMLVVAEVESAKIPALWIARVWHGHIDNQLALLNVCGSRFSAVV